MIVLGAHNNNPGVSEASKVTIPIERQFIHEDWNPSLIDNDIMLFKLAEEVEFSDEISPVCLPDPSDELHDGDEMITSGWGRLSCEFLIFCFLKSIRFCFCTGQSIFHIVSVGN